MVTIYTKPNCINCVNTKRVLDAAHVSYTTVDVTENQEAFDYVVGRNVRQMPYVETDDDAWSGMNKAKLGRLVAMSAQATKTSTITAS